MPLINALLVRSGVGWSERTDAGSIVTNSRFEGYLALGAIQTEDGVNAYADAQLDLYATPREEINAGIAPIGAADTPYIGYQVGDTVTVPDSAGSPVVERVRGITVTENDDTGVAVYSPQFKDFMLERDEQIQIAIKRMSNGSIAGSSQVAQPIRENFVPREVVAALEFSSGGSEEFDAMVDQALSADDLGATPPQFRTVQSAITTMYGLGFIYYLKIGVAKRSVKVGDTTVVALATCPAYVHIKGLRSGSSLDPATAPVFDGGTPTSTWDWGGQRHSFATALIIEDMDVRFGGGATILFPTKAPLFTIVRRSYIDGNSTTAQIATWGRNVGGETIWSDESTWVDTTLFTDRVWMTGGDVVFNLLTAPVWGGASSSSALYMLGVQVAVMHSGAQTWTLDFISNYVAGCWFSVNNWQIGASSIFVMSVIFSVSNHGVYWDATASQWGNNSTMGLVSITTSNNPLWGIFRGNFKSLTLAGRAAPSANSPGCQVDAILQGTLDVTGPASVNVTVGPGAGNAIIRGESVVGQLEINYNAAASALQLIAATYCNLDVAGRLFAAAGVQTPYNLDAASTNNYIRYSGVPLFPVAGVDAGAVNRVGTPEVAGS